MDGSVSSVAGQPCYVHVMSTLSVSLIPQLLQSFRPLSLMFFMSWKAVRNIQFMARHSVLITDHYKKKLKPVVALV